MQTSRFLAVVGTLVGLVVVATLVALYLLGTSLGGLGGGAEDPEPPTVQQDFLAVVRDGQEQADGANDVQLVQARIDRDAGICDLGGGEPPVVRGWWGTVRDIETGLLGDDAELVLDLEDDVELVGAADTSIRPDTPLYEAIAALEDGDEVRFDGRLVPDPESCVAEQSLLLRNNVETPGFELALQAIERR